MMLDTLQKAMLEGMRIYYKAAFWSADMIQDQAQKYWNMLLEQNGKVRNEMESLAAIWAANMKRSREELQRDLEKSLGMIEEGASGGDGSLWPLAAAVKPWADAQAEIMRSWMGMWGFSPSPITPNGEKEKAGEAAAKSK